MNTVFIIHSGRVETQEPVEYWNIVRQQAQDCYDELTGGYPFDRGAAMRYLDENWRQNLEAYNFDTGEREPVEVSDEQWTSYRDDLLGEVRKLALAITYRSMQEITGHEAGAVCWPGGEIWIGNWVGIEGLPRGLAGAWIGMGEDLTAEACAVPSEAIAALNEHEIAQGSEPSKSGFHAWQVNEAVIVIQDDWN